MPDGPLHSIDVPFSVPLVHRLRVTEDVAGDDFDVLLDVLEADDAVPAKVLVVAESAVVESSDRVRRIRTALESAKGVRVVGQTLVVAGGEPVKNSTESAKAILRAIKSTRHGPSQLRNCNWRRRNAGCSRYAAAVAHRGIRLVRLPTTTLAQADSGVGVKNAINYFGKKNWVGTFAAPWAVVNDSKLLETLSARDFRSGFSEAVKVSLLKDRQQFDWLCNNADAIRERDMNTATKAIHRSCMMHLRHITEGGDPFEMLEARPLDFGHWSAHKLEPITNYEIRHGEAVAIGVALDCLYSSMKLQLPESDAMRVCDCLSRLGMNLWHDAILPTDQLLKGLEEFRQHLGGRLTITMLQGIGDPVNVHEIDINIMHSAIERLRSISQDSSTANVGVLASR